MNKRKNAIGAILLLVFSILWVTNAMADSEWSLLVGHLEFDPQFSQEAGMGDEAWEISGEVEFEWTKNLRFGLGVGLIFLDDKMRLNVRVVDVNFPTVPFTAQSNETGGSLSAFLKFQLPVNDRFSINALGGYKHVNFEREISSCTDCPTDEIDFDNGGYFGAGITVRPGKKMNFTLRYQSFLSDDIDSQILLGIGGSF